MVELLLLFTFHNSLYTLYVLSKKVALAEPMFYVIITHFIAFLMSAILILKPKEMTSKYVPHWNSFAVHMYFYTIRNFYLRIVDS